MAPRNLFYPLILLLLPFFFGGCDGWPSSGTTAGARSTVESQPNAAATERPPLTPGTPEEASAAPILRLIPADAMLAVNARPLPRELNPDLGATWIPQTQPTQGSAFAAIRRLVEGFVEKELKPRDIIGLRIGEAFVEALNYPYALAMLDVGARPLPNRPEASRMDGLRLVGIIEAGEDKSRFLRIIQDVVDATTQEKFTTIAKRESHGLPYYELSDTRLDSDDTFSWAELNDYFIIAFGKGTIDAVAACAAGVRESIRSDGWVPDVRAKHADDTYFEMLVNANRIRAGLDPEVNGAASDFFKAWESEEFVRTHWAFGMIGRAMSCIVHFDNGSETFTRVFAEPLPADSATLELIPANTNYTVYRLDMGRFLRHLVLGLVATRDPNVKHEIERAWADMEREYEFDAQAEFLDQLGDTAIMHKFPVHPLKLPFAVTTLIEIDGDPQLVARCIHKMCTAWETLQTTEVEKGIVAPAKLLQQRGTWFLSFGFLGGPAWIVTEKYVISSWSANALHQYLSEAGDKVGAIVPFENE
ncbi:MAG: hypothetical protein AB7N71_09215 [Phycisphaerae bacterium]